MSRWRPLAALAGLLALAAIDAQGSGAFAQARLEARYAASLAGIPLGKGTWFVDISGNQYVASASGATTGLVKVFTGGQGSGSARGTIVSGNLVPASYSVSVTTDKRTEEVQMTLGGGNVKDVVHTPEKKWPSRAIPLTESHRRNVIDPMTASLVSVRGNGDTLLAEACNRNLAVFDGSLRYDLDFVFKRMDSVKPKLGYVGPVVVCAVYFSPVAGHVPERAAIKYLTALRDMEVWLAPVAGTRVLAPFRFSVPTPLGLGVLEATEFNVRPLPSKASITVQ
ncbi:MAG: DUF3108 domain-containing protein [Pseudorhodoplanes sp.]|nr:DUF3108 domain-containing protein [Pseudorhodoplanes sp.]GIK79795.1 MAG: hypothetical protein BroJett024_09000 [Alphaproteobacteria bacterium]